MPPCQVLTTVVPLYNPPEGWHSHFIAFYTQAVTQLPSYQHHLIFVNDGSSQPVALPNLPDACNFTQALINIAPNKGKGNAVRTGAQAAKPGYLLFTDADFPYTVESFLKIVRAIEAGNNVVPGVRNQSYYQGVTTFRSRLSRMHSWFIRSLIGITISDTQCGLKGFDAIGVQVLLRTQIHRFLFDLELICRAQNNREIKVETVEVDLRPTVEVSQFGVAVLLKEGINFAKIVFLNANGKLK